MVNTQYNYDRMCVVTYFLIEVRISFCQFKQMKNNNNNEVHHFADFAYLWLSCAFNKIYQS